ncbi:hypothetical protein [Thermodesulfatator atlanticus]|uniref:hypothetical protein n=1 Tax=Thermodesulfatator atlanticus TaxID=501497 RepID=UPI0003B68CED|nr:hypothetical protein [Thermodesulfatator atlanticus]
MAKIDGEKRSFIKKAMVVAGAALVLGGAKARAKKEAAPAKGEILYRETEAFRKYYETLKR